MPDQMNAADAGIENPHDFAEAVLRALGLKDMRHVLALELSIPGAGCVPVVKISRALTKGETRELALAIETQRFKLVPDGQPEHDGFDPDSCESTPVGKMVTVQPLRRRFAVTLPLAEHGPEWPPLQDMLRVAGDVEVPYTDANGAVWRPGWPATEPGPAVSADPSAPSACASDALRSSAPDPQPPAVAPGSAAVPSDPPVCPETGKPSGAGEA